MAGSGAEKGHSLVSGYRPPQKNYLAIMEHELNQKKEVEAVPGSTPVELKFYTADPSEVGPKSLPIDEGGKLAEWENEIQKHKVEFDQHLAGLQFYIKNNMEAERMDPVIYHFHRIRLKRKLIVSGTKIYEAEVAKSLWEMSNLKKTNQQIPSNLENRVKQLKKFIEMQKFNYALVESYWLDFQNVADTIYYNKLKKRNGGSDNI